MQAFVEPLKELAEFEEIQKEKKKQKGMIQIAGCVNSQKTHLMYALGDDSTYRIIAVSSEAKAKQIYEEYKFLDEKVYYYPPKDLLFYQADLRGKALVKQRLEVMQAVLTEEKVTVITEFDGFMDSLLPLQKIQERIFTLKVGDTVDFDSLKEKVAALGYDREVQIDGMGQFAVRGGIIDIYPLTEEVPIRIEFWDDEIDSIRTFDVESQRSIENLRRLSFIRRRIFRKKREKEFLFWNIFL